MTGADFDLYPVAGRTTETLISVDIGPTAAQVGFYTESYTASGSYRGDSVYVGLTPDEADDLATALRAFAQQVRGL